MWLGLMIAMQAAAPAPVEPLFDSATGYRVARYRSVVPSPPHEVTAIDSDQALHLHDRDAALFLDVTPADGGYRDPATGNWRLAREHRTLPRALWFPEAGRGILSDPIGRWFFRGVQVHAKGRPIVVFCLSDCWMSWNAAMRLQRMGYADVRWFADGVDGWRERRWPMIAAAPVAGAIGE